MQLKTQSEWMKAQKHADVMGPGGKFNVIQTSSEGSIFLSIGTDSVLYATKEVQASETGWNRLDLSSVIANDFAGSTVTVKSFDVSQDAQSGTFDLALGVTVNGSDHLYMSVGNDFTDSSALANGVSWTSVPFDANNISPGSVSINISDISILHVSSSSNNQGSTCVVDIWRSNTNSVLDRYYIVANKLPRWNLHLLPIDLDANTVNSVVGQRTKDRIPGIYTFGSLNGEQEISYATIYNWVVPSRPPQSSQFTVPTGATSIASAVDPQGHSCLFVSHSAGLSVYPPTAQDPFAVSQLCIAGSIVSGATQLFASITGPLTTVWGRNAQGSLFYSTCPAGHETASASWSAPILLLPSVEQFAFYTGTSTHSQTLFAHVDGQDIVELAQDPVTSNWRQRNISLPSTDVNDIIEFDSYTTRIEVVDDNGVPQPQVSVNLATVSPVPVYVNNVYYVLNPGNTVSVQTDDEGSLTMVQQTDSLAAVCYDISLPSVNKQPTLVNPAAKVIATLQGIQKDDGSDLAGVQVTDSDGNKRYLLPDSVRLDSDTIAAASRSLKQFTAIGQELNPDGTPTPASNQLAATKQNSGTHGFTLRSTPGTEASRLQFSKTSGTAKISLAVSDGTSFLVKAGDFFRMLGDTVAEGFHSLEVQLINGVHHIFATIGNVLYHAALDTLHAIVHACQWVFSQLKVLWEDLVAWLGFIFEWKDILRTHNVMKTFVKAYVNKMIEEIDSLEDKIDASFDGLEDRLNAWAGITDNGETHGILIKSDNNPDSGSSSPQANWGVHHVKSNLNNSDTDESTPSVSDGLKDILNDLVGAVSGEVDIVSDIVDQLQTQVIDPFQTLTAKQVIQRIIGIISDFILKSTKNIVLSVVDLIKNVATTVFSLLDATINIPVLTPFYKDLTDGSNLSFLDLIMLVGAIPTTIIYKLGTDEAPFPDNDVTASLINAADYSTFIGILGNGSSNDVTSLAVRSSGSDSKHFALNAKAVAPPSNALVKFLAACRIMSALSAVVFQVAQDLNFEYKKSAPPKVVPMSLKKTIAAGALGMNINAFLGSIGTTTWYSDMNYVMVSVFSGYVMARVFAGPAMEAVSSSLDPSIWIALQACMIPAPAAAFAAGFEGGKTPRASAWVGFSAMLAARLAGTLNPTAMMLDTIENPKFLVAANVAQGFNVLLGTTGGELLALGK